jgi:hypothetical protein
METKNGIPILTSPLINENVALTATATKLNLAGLHAPYDRLAGVLGTQSGWNTAPTNLANMTDGDWTTATGLGVNTNVTTYAWAAGYIKFDMGAIYNVMLQMLITIGSTYAGQQTSFIIQGSVDDSTWYVMNPNGSGYTGGVFNNNNSVLAFYSLFTRARYLMLQVANNGGNTSTLSLGVTEIKALDFGF